MDCNAQERKRTRKLTHYVRWLPIAVVAGLMAWVYVVYVAFFLVPRLNISIWLGLASALGFHILFGLVLWAYIQCVRVHPGRVSQDWSLVNPPSDVDVSSLRTCPVCQVYKPPRAHHCSTCNQCILLFDHHCPWINNCVGLRNRKHFLLFLFYVPATTLWICLTSIDSFDLFSPQGPQDGATYDLMYLFAAVMGIALGLFFCGSFCMALNDQTTFDVVTHRAHGFSGYWLQNVIAICGDRPWLWLLPLTPPDDHFLQQQLPSIAGPLV